MHLDIYSKEIQDSLIFVVDDEPVNLKLIVRILEGEGFTNVYPINDSLQVIQKYKEKRPLLIMLDINMPQLNGFDVLEQLKGVDNTTLPPVVFITAQNTHNYRTKAFESGVLDYISKPFNRLELLSRVKNLVALEIAHQNLNERNMTLEVAVENRTAALRKSKFQLLQILGRAAEFRDNETGAHLLRMSSMSAHIASKYGFNDEESNNILYASPMHDVGKIAIPDHILLKPGKFDKDEWEIMKTHTTLGYEILNADDSPLLKLASEIAMYHHEKWDGSGYPHGLTDTNIPISCRIVALADVFDALTSERPYKKAWSVKDAQELINSEAGKHFDPEIVKIFNKNIDYMIDIKNKYLDEDSDAADKKVEVQALWRKPENVQYNSLSK